MIKRTRPEPPTPEQYQRAKINKALSYAPHIHACKKCGWPVIYGYCCTYCGDDNPSEATSHENQNG